ncbi:hypothetical protein H696_00284 [Fonticula alba]|uniref:U2A'/phosphoprotein 32 family A C-terminal domain-containing protein n=1 Tax=Fonticula alba TaxID=691883 RepID=A0A058ZE76_FONAL|nr:hypothetical protein H696_00284 [Fonticula alba]KCV72705.1 hypothetical protein H696_00284 [Fonticula alba]|eukprot:XP_009492406.1 hypothetical protein H696_00284 [Fonticula alba]
MFSSWFSTPKFAHSMVDVTLAYRDLTIIDPLEFAEVCGAVVPSSVNWLDLSHNKLEDLSSISQLDCALKVLVVDHNQLTGHIGLSPDSPVTQSLRVLWLNHNQFTNLASLVQSLLLACPELTELSLLGNPACPNWINGGSVVEYTHYRNFIVVNMPGLQVLDGDPITPAERDRASASVTPTLSSRQVPSFITKSCVVGSGPAPGPAPTTVDPMLESDSTASACEEATSTSAKEALSDDDIPSTPSEEMCPLCGNRLAKSPVVGCANGCNQNDGESIMMQPFEASIVLPAEEPAGDESSDWTDDEA